jgi:hypothetical protein
MNNLTQLHEKFKDYIMYDDPAIENAIQGASQEELLARLSIYQTAYTARLLEILKKDFPITLKLMGEDSFKNKALEYIANQEAKEFSLRILGQHFPAFLLHSYLSIANVAQFEWLIDEMLDSEDAELLSLADLQGQGQEELANYCFQLHSSVRLFANMTNAAELWLAWFNQEELPELESLSDSHTVLVWRQNISPQFRSCLPHEVWILQKIQEGRSFGEICELLSELPEEETAGLLVNLIYQWIDEGILIK